MMANGLTYRIAAPPVAGFLLVAAYVVVELFGVRPLALPEGDTSAEAAAMGHAAQTLQLMRTGHDASSLQTVRAGILDHASHELTPLEAAVLGRQPELVRLLQRSGATTDPARARCFARMRLPEVLEDLGGSATAAADQGADVQTTLSTCTEGHSR